MSLSSSYTSSLSPSINDVVAGGMAKTTPTATSSTSSSSVSMTTHRLQWELLERMKLLLPAAMSSLPASYGPMYKHNKPWTLLHATCVISCPLAMVKLALTLDEDSIDAIRTRDLRAGRYPLHYAAGRLGYHVQVPVGIDRNLQSLHEPSPLFIVFPCFPQAARAHDNHGQLPLHVTIDAAKHRRALATTTMTPSTTTTTTKTTSSDHDDHNMSNGGASTESTKMVRHINAAEREILRLLIAYHPGSLEHRDGKSKLYPWQQAAVGKGANLQTIYHLLRLQPTLIGYP